jgi:ribosome-binding ATPase YchF (GTP1/OBG family)
MITLALAGKPNCGKSTFFKAAAWSGKTALNHAGKPNCGKSTFFKAAAWKGERS